MWRSNKQILWGRSSIHLDTENFYEFLLSYSLYAKIMIEYVSSLVKMDLVGGY